MASPLAKESLDDVCGESVILPNDFQETKQLASVYIASNFSKNINSKLNLLTTAFRIVVLTLFSNNAKKTNTNEMKKPVAKSFRIFLSAHFLTFSINPFTTQS